MKSVMADTTSDVLETRVLPNGLRLRILHTPDGRYCLETSTPSGRIVNKYTQSWKTEKTARAYLEDWGVEPFAAPGDAKHWWLGNSQYGQDPPAHPYYASVYWPGGTFVSDPSFFGLRVARFGEPGDDEPREEQDHHV